MMCNPKLSATVSLFVIILLPVLFGPSARSQDSTRTPLRPLSDPFSPAFQLGTVQFAAAGVGANYSFRSNYNQWGIHAGLLSGPIGGQSQFEIDPGYHHYSNDYGSGYTSNGSIVDVNAIYVWNKDAWRFGPTVGYHWNSWTESYNGTGITTTNSSLYNNNGNAHAYNLGGYGEWLPECNFTGSLKAGYAFGDEPGLYAGLSAGYYFCDDFDLCGDFDYYDYNSWESYSICGEWQVSQTMPLAISAGYSLTSFANSGRLSLGLQYRWNIPAATTLHDRERTGLLPNYQYRF